MPESWDTLTRTVSGTPGVGMTITYAGTFDRIGAMDHGLCEPGTANRTWTIGVPWPTDDPTVLPMPDATTDPDVGGWVAMSISAGFYVMANLAWNCTCDDPCALSDGTISGSLTAASDDTVLADYQGNPCTTHTADDFIVPGQAWQLGSHDIGNPSFFAPSDPPVAFNFSFSNAGNHIIMSFNMLVAVFWSAPPPVPPPLPLPWPSPTMSHGAPPQCGSCHPT